MFPKLAEFMEGCGIDVDRPRIPGLEAVVRPRGSLAISTDLCTGCGACTRACPTRALSAADRPESADGGESLRVFYFDRARCLLCGDCLPICPEAAISFDPAPDPPVGDRGALVSTMRFTLAGLSERRGYVPAPDLPAVPQDVTESAPASHTAVPARAEAVSALSVLYIATGGCNGCEVEASHAAAPPYDLASHGITFTERPESADAVLLTGPLTPKMEGVVRDLLARVPHPRVVIAAGACALSGGPFRSEAGDTGGVLATTRIDLHLPGCPPSPRAIVDALRRVTEPGSTCP